MNHDGDVHMESAIGQLQLEASEVAAQVLEAEATRDDLEARRDELSAELGALPASASIDRAGKLFTQLNGVTWLSKQAETELRSIRDDARAVGDQLDAHRQRASKLEDELERIELPELGWTQPVRDLHRAAARAQLHWLQGDPADDQERLEAAREALDGYAGEQASVARGDQNALRGVIRKLERRLDTENEAVELDERQAPLPETETPPEDGS